MILTAFRSVNVTNEYRRQFGSDDSVFLVYRAKDGDVFSRESLLAIQQLTNDLRYWQQQHRRLPRRDQRHQSRF